MRKSAGIIRVPDKKKQNKTQICVKWQQLANSDKTPVTPVTVCRLTLVDELVEGMLPIGPWFTPHNWSCVVVHTAAVFGDVLPVRLHVALETRRTRHTGNRSISCTHTHGCMHTHTPCEPKILLLTKTSS